MGDASDGTDVSDCEEEGEQSKEKKAKKDKDSDPDSSSQILTATTRIVMMTMRMTTARLPPRLQNLPSLQGKSSTQEEAEGESHTNKCETSVSA